MNIPDYPGTDADFADQGIVPEKETPDPDMKPEIVNIPVNYRSCRLNLIVVSALFVAVLGWSVWVPWVNGFMMYLFGVWVCLFLDFWTVWAKRDEDWVVAQARLRDLCRDEAYRAERRAVWAQRETQKLEDAELLMPPVEMRTDFEKWAKQEAAVKLMADYAIGMPIPRKPKPD